MDVIPANYDFEANYQQYLATQKRVSRWVRQTHSETQSTAKKSRRSSSKTSSGRSAGRREKSTKTIYETSFGPGPHGSYAVGGTSSVSPTMALISSLLFVCALLPSILTVSAFVLMLSFASMGSNDILEGDNAKSSEKIMPSALLL